MGLESIFCYSKEQWGLWGIYLFISEIICYQLNSFNFFISTANLQIARQVAGSLAGPSQTLCCLLHRASNTASHTGSRTASTKAPASVTTNATLITPGVDPV